MTFIAKSVEQDLLGIYTLVSYTKYAVLLVISTFANVTKIEKF